MFEDFNLKNKDKQYLAILIAFSAVLVAYYINFNVNLGLHCSDVYLYLLNGIYFTGVPIHYPENIYLSPPICFLTSLLFRLGLVDKTAIFIVTGIFAGIGNIGLYLLLRRYFDETLSLTGAVIYSTFTLNLTWLANGSLDISAVTFTIWIALIAIMAIKDNPRYYRYIFILLALAFYTRYTTMLILPALLIYYVFENGFTIKPEDRKDMVIGIILGMAVFALIAYVIHVMGNGSSALLNQFTKRASNTGGSKKDPAYNPDSLYYLKNMLNFISNSNTTFGANPELNNPTVLSGIIAAILAIGSLLWAKTRKFNIKKDITAIILLFSPFISLALAIPRATDIEVLLCPVLKLSYILSLVLGNPAKPSSFLKVSKLSFLPVNIL